MRILRKRQRIYQVIFVILLSVFCLLALLNIKEWLVENAFDLNLPLFIDKGAPFEKEISKVIQPLRYDGIHIILNPEFDISLDFENKAWILDNARNYNRQGKIALEQGRYGVCGELAAYVYDKIKPLFDDKKYKIEFVNVSESGYFISPKSTHVIIRITETSIFSSDKTFILDPSFRRYGSIDKFENYNFYNTYEMLPLMINKERDIRYYLGSAFPLLIRKKKIVLLSVKAVDDKFDKDNFAIVLSINKQHAFVGRPLIIFSKMNGKSQVFKYQYPHESPLTKKEYDDIVKKLSLVFEGL